MNRIAQIIHSTISSSVNRNCLQPSPRCTPSLSLGAQLALFITLLLTILPAQAKAIEPVAGRYLISYGTTIRFEVRVLFPPPASLIVEQYFPEGLEIVSASPIPQKYSSKRGKSKWFFKEMQAGTSVISLQFDRPVQSSEIQAVLRYRYPGRGHFVETTITP